VVAKMFPMRQRQLPNCPLCGHPMAAQGLNAKKPELMFYTCPHCDTYYDRSLRALPNDEAALARKEVEAMMRAKRGKS